MPVRFPFFNPKNKYFFPAIILLLSLLARIIYFSIEKSHPLFLYPIIDETELLKTARYLAENSFHYPYHYWHPPLYSWLLALLFVAGFSLKGIVVFQMLMGAAGTLLLYYSLKQINNKIALITAIIWAIYPVELFIETKFLSENLFIFLSLLLTYFLLKKDTGIKSLLVTALICGLLVITKSQFLIFCLFYMLFLYFFQKEKISRILTWFALMMLLPMVFSLANTSNIGGRFVFVSTNGPSNLYVGNSADIKKTLNIRPYEWRKKFFPELYTKAGIKIFEQVKDSNITFPYKLSPYLTRQTIKDNANLIVLFKNLFYKTIIAFHSQETARNYDLYEYKKLNAYLGATTTGKFVYFPLLLFFYAALIYLFVRRKEIFKSPGLLVLLMLTAAFILPSILFFNAFRYRLSAVPYLVFFALLFYTEYGKNWKFQLINLGLIALLGTDITSHFLIQKIPRAETYNYFGRGYFEKQKTSRAEYWFGQAAKWAEKESGANNCQIYKNSGYTKEQNGDLKGAELDYSMAISLKPEEPDARLLRASVRYKLSDFTGSVSDYDTVLLFDTLNISNRLNAFYGRALSRFKSGNLTGAMEDFSFAIDLKPDYSEAFSGRGIVKAQAGDEKGALDDFNEAIRLDPANYAAYSNRASARGRSGDIKGALADLDKVIELKPDYAQAYFMKGMVLVDMNKKDDACRNLKKALELGYKNAESVLKQLKCN